MLSNAYNIDCLVGMKKFPDKHFDLAVVDPPYGINIANRSACLGKKKRQGKITNYTAKKWDANTPDAEYFKELFRISKKQIIWGGTILLIIYHHPNVGLSGIKNNLKEFLLQWQNWHILHLT